MNDEPFRRGETILLPFLIVADGAIVNISDGTVTAEVRVGSRLVEELVVGHGLTIEQPAPEPELDQVPHGLITIGPDITNRLPLESQTSVTVFFVNSAGVRMHVPPFRLRGIP